jgi:hypothetical protein
MRQLKAVVIATLGCVFFLLPAYGQPEVDTADIKVVPGLAGLTEQDVIDSYVYVLGRYLVIRQEHVDIAEEGVDYNGIKYNELGKAEFVNPNLDVAYLEAWFAVDDNTPVILEIPKIEGRYYTAEIMDEWAEILYNINERNFPKTPYGKFALVLERLTKRMFQCVHTDQCTAEAEESFVNVVAPFVTHTQSSELVEPAYRSLDHPAQASQAAAVLRVALRDHRLDPTHPQEHAVQVRIVRPIGVQAIRFATGTTHLAADRRNRIDQRQQLGYVVLVGAGEPNGKRNAVRIRDEVVLRAFLAAIGRVGAGFFAPPTARTDPLSTTARDQSIWSAARSRSKNRRWSRSQTPAACQSRRRRQQVIPEPQPISCGRYSQGMPVLSTKRIPVSASRSPTGGRPPLGRGGRLGISGLINRHKSSVTSGLAIVVSSLTQVPLTRWPYHPRSSHRFKEFC